MKFNGVPVTWKDLLRRFVARTLRSIELYLVSTSDHTCRWLRDDVQAEAYRLVQDSHGELPMPEIVVYTSDGHLKVAAYVEFNGTMTDLLDDSYVSHTALKAGKMAVDQPLD